MRSMVVVLLLAFVTVLASRNATIEDQTFDINEDGSYDLRFKTSNGISSSEKGVSYPGADPETGNYVRSGSYSYQWQGVSYTVNWTADENGFHPQGDHLPDYSHTRAHVASVEDELRAVADTVQQ